MTPVHEDDSLYAPTNCDAGPAERLQPAPPTRLAVASQRRPILVVWKDGLTGVAARDDPRPAIALAKADGKPRPETECARAVPSSGMPPPGQPRQTE